jgi:hypothetical protein
MELVTLENFASVDQHAWDEKGVRHTIAANSVVHRDVSLAKLFLSQAGKFVRKYKPLPMPNGIPGEGYMWLANMTGNPILPKELKVEQTDRKTGIVSFITKVNPLAQAVTVGQRYGQGQAHGTETDGSPTLINLPAVWIKIPPITRVRAPISIGKWLLMMDGDQEADCRGRLIACRAPTEFEPNESWDYDDMRLFAQLMDAPIDTKKAYPPARELKNAVDEYKEKLFNNLFYFIVDERYQLPPKHAFDAAKAAQKQ